MLFLEFILQSLLEFYFFRMFFVISIIGIFHSFVILPIVLTYINISNNKENERVSKFKEKVLVDDDDKE